MTEGQRCLINGWGAQMRAAGAQTRAGSTNQCWDRWGSVKRGWGSRDKGRGALMTVWGTPQGLESTNDSCKHE